MNSDVDRNYKFLILSSFLTLIAITYFPGVFLYHFFKEKFHSYYAYDSAAWPSLIFVIVLLSIVCSVFIMLIEAVPSIRIKKFRLKFIDNLFFCISMIFFLMGVYFLINFDISFRHKNRLGESGVIVISLFFIRYVALYYLMLCLSEVLRNGSLSKNSMRNLFFFSIGWAFALNSSFQVLYLFFSFFLCFYPNIYLKTFTFSFSRIWVWLFILPMAVAAVLLVGIGNKVGIRYLFTAAGLDFIYGYVGSIAARASTSLYSLAYVFENHLFDFGLFLKMVNYEWLTFLNRINMFLPGRDYDSDAIYTVSRYNYLMAFDNHAERAGATPGIFASIFYAGGIPSGLIIISMYLSITYRSLRKHFLNIKRPSLLSIACLAYLMIPFIENPLSFVNLLQPITVYILLVFIVSRFIPLEVRYK